MSVVNMGLCGWTDASLISSKRFYPSSCINNIDRLKYLSESGLLNSVEINTSTYSIPNSDFVKKWVNATNKNDFFVFHFKIFGIFCLSKVNLNQLPTSIRTKYNMNSASASASIIFDQLTREMKEDLWQAFNDSIQPVIDANKVPQLTIDTFQFRTIYSSYLIPFIFGSYYFMS